MKWYVAHVKCSEDGFSETYISLCPDSWDIDKLRNHYISLCREPIFISFTDGFNVSMDC